MSEWEGVSRSTRILLYGRFIVYRILKVRVTMCKNDRKFPNSARSSVRKYLKRAALVCKNDVKNQDATSSVKIDDVLARRLFLGLLVLQLTLLAFWVSSSLLYFDSNFFNSNKILYLGIDELN